MSKAPAAKALLRRGFEVLPVEVGKKFPPLLTDWPDRAAKTEAEVEAMWAAVPHANPAIHAVGMIVLDVDTRSGGPASLAALPDLPPTLTTITPTQGKHLFFRLPKGHPGANNSAGKLGPGIDVKTKGGYVLGPGSDVDAGRYHLADPKAQIAEAPQWLLDRLGLLQSRQRDATPAEAIPPAPEYSVAQARLWLAGQPAGEGAFATACGLRDRGLSLDQALSLMAEHDPRDTVPIKVEHAYRYAENVPGVKVALPSDFPVVPESSTNVPELGTFTRVQRLSEFSNGERRSPGYLVKGLLLRGTYAEAYGAPGEGKTFVTLDLAYAVAAGKDWMERKVHPGLVLYLAYEGVGGLVARGKALRQHYGAKDVPLYVADAAYNLRDLTGRAALGEDIAALPEKPVLIVFDTFARALCGGDENSAQDVGAFNEGVKALIAYSGACVLVVHHTGKDPSKGARGSSALLAALDTEIHIHAGSITPTKQRDIEVGEPIGFKLHPVVVGIDQDGDEQTSCVVVAGAVRQEMERITGNNKRGFDVLCDLSPDNAPVSEEAWLEACTGFLPERGTAKRFWDIKTKLIQRGYIEVDKTGRVTRRME